MKLTPEQIERIEEVLTDVEDGLGNRGVIIKHGLRDMNVLTNFLAVLKDLGIRVQRGAITKLSSDDRRAFAEFLRMKRKQQEAAE